MAVQRKLSRPTDQRTALLRGQVTDLLWYGKIETTYARAKEVSKIAEKIITKAIAARRAIMGKVYDKPEIRGEKEKKAAFVERTKNIKHPIIEKIFNEYAPKYDQRAKELGQGGGYTRVLKLGFRAGDSAEAAIVELV